MTKTEGLAAQGEMSLRDQILDISRQNRIGPLSRWFSEALDYQIALGRFAPIHTLELVRQSIIHRLTSYRLDTGAHTVVLGMSGGVDSALTAALAKAAGYRVIGVTMPIHQDPMETQRGIEACEALGIEHMNVDLTDLYDQTLKSVGDFDLAFEKEPDKALRIRRGNVRARLRMVTLYNFASKYGGFVLSTDNFSELMAGFWTINGDVGDVAPIQSLWKSWDVPILAKLSGVPESTWRATPTDGLGVDQGDEAQLGSSYLEWDLIVMTANDLLVSAMKTVDVDFTSSLVFEYKQSKSEMIDLLVDDLNMFDDGDRAKARAVIGRISRSWFKRKNPLNFDHPLEPRLEIADRIDSLFLPKSAS